MNLLSSFIQQIQHIRVGSQQVIFTSDRHLSQQIINLLYTLVIHVNLPLGGLDNHVVSVGRQVDDLIIGLVELIVEELGAGLQRVYIDARSGGY